MAFMKDILTRNIPIWEECAATPFVQEVQTGKLPLEKFKRYMIQDSIYLKNYARIYGKAIFHADTLREIQLYYSMLNFVNDTESEVRLDYLKQFCMTDNDIELIAPLPENQNYIDESYGGFHLDRHSNSTGRCTYSEYSRGRENSRYADFHSFRYGGCRKKNICHGL